MLNKTTPRAPRFGITVVPLLIAVAQLILHVAFLGNYNYFRDELYYIACSNHLAFGYVDQPSLSLAVLRATRMVLGDSLFAIRLLPAVSGAVVVLIAASMARRLGGGRFAQGLAALCVMTTQVLLGVGSFYSMNAFDVLFWAVAAALVVRILAGDSQKLWVWFGVVVGLGLLNKYSIGFECIGIVGGLLLTAQRRQLASRWFWFGALVAFLLFLPHLVWEYANGFPSLEFMRNATSQKNVPLSPTEFLLGQLQIANPCNAPVWLAGLWFFFRRAGKAFRPLGWTFALVVAILAASNPKLYYLSPVYPMLLAGGATFGEEVVSRRRLRWLKPVIVAATTLWGAIAAPFVIPILPVEKFIAYEALLGASPRAEEINSVAELPQYYADQFGWEELADSIGHVYQSLSPQDQARCVIFMRNYGEAGALDFYGKRYELPPVLCGHNSYWYWGPGDRSGDVAIVMGDSRDLEENMRDLRRYFNDVSLATVTNARYCMPFENHRQIFLCRGLNTTIQKLWPSLRFFI